MSFKEVTEDRIILALDGLSKEESFKLVNEVGGSVYAVKIHDLYDRYGPGIVNELMMEGAGTVWTDFKLHDIPTTVGLRAKALAESGAGIVSVHASGGRAMMEAAVSSAARVYAITVLTSLGEYDVASLYNSNISTQVQLLAQCAKKASVRGIVCSPKELQHLTSGVIGRELSGLEFIVPGTRSLGADHNDQARVDTPANAIANGATRLVIGRQVTKADDPVEALEKIAQEITLAAAGGAA